MLKYGLSALWLLILVSVQAQNRSVKGVVKDSASGERLSFAEISLSPNQKFALSDQNGIFQFLDLSEGYKTLRIRHVGCETKEVKFNLISDTFLVIFLGHHEHQFEAHVVYGHHTDEEVFIDHEKTLSGKSLQLIQHQSMGEILTGINGVYSLKTGQAISKPVIRGLQGNRIIIADNGLKLESQQWGDEHAPELDSRGAETFKVLKGAGTLRYGYDALGGIILAEPGKIGDSMQISSGITAIGNGKGIAGFLKLNVPANGGGWQLSAGFKKAGDQRAPEYILTNTGYEEITTSLRRIDTSRYLKFESALKFFYNKPGILKASHIGNLTDLTKALSYSEPQVQLPFSYQILRPFQQVMHTTLLQKVKFKSRKSEHLFQYGFQLNQRKEFDNRRGDDQVPQLDFLLQSHQLEWNLQRHTGIHFQQSGVQSSYQTNRQQGFLLIPNYRKITNGLYYIHRLESERMLLEAGIRADLQQLTAFFYTDSGTRSVPKQFSGVSSNVSFQYQLNHDWMFYLQFSELWRAPSINELYSNGLHHGAAALEYGDENLKKEQSTSGAFTVVYNHNKFGFELEPYVRYIRNFISLQPQFPSVLTIRGAFPVFAFSTNNVWFKGADAQWNWNPYQQWLVKGQYSVMQVKTNEGKYLNGMPPVTADHQIKYLLSTFKKFRNIQLLAGYKYFFEQVWADPKLDYMPPPKGYGLLKAGISAELHGKKLHTISASADNLLNTAYRDYLSRLRYYTNEPGFSFYLSYIIQI